MSEDLKPELQARHFEKAIALATQEADARKLRGAARDRFVVSLVGEYMSQLKRGYNEGYAKGVASVHADLMELQKEPNFSRFQGFIATVYSKTGDVNSAIALLRALGEADLDDDPLDPAVALEMLDRGVDPIRVGLLIRPSGQPQ